MSKRQRHSTVQEERLVRRDMVFPFGPTTPERQYTLNKLYAELSQRVYSTRAEFVVSEDKTQTKIILWCNIAQENNLDNFTRGVPGVKMLSESDPIEETARIIRLYHRNLWNELDFPHEEMHLSALVTGIAMRLSVLDYPNFREQEELWKLAEECYKAMGQADVFGDLVPYAEMIGYSFVGGYLADQGRFEKEEMTESAKMKAQVLLMEEKGRPDIIIHTFIQLLRDKLIASGHRNAMELVKATFK